MVYQPMRGSRARGQRVGIEGVEMANCQRCIDCAEMVGYGPPIYRCYGRKGPPDSTPEYKRDMGTVRLRISPTWCPKRKNPSE